MLTLLVSLLIGCGGTPCESACNAANDCATAAGATATDCATACEGDDGSNDEMYGCIEDAYGAGDCSTVEGLTEVSAAALECMGGISMDTGM